MDWKRNRLGFIKKPLLFHSLPIIFFFFSISSLFCTGSSTSTTCPDSKCPMSTKIDAYNFQELKKPMMVNIGDEEEVSLSLARRLLSGPGSTPPRCLWKCGSCTPCKPVHVSVPPGTPVTAEYYPEAWRCKCGNKLFMP
ncbi:hypothetical protein UlMin_012986 [Ulmus minor]